MNKFLIETAQKAETFLDKVLKKTFVDLPHDCPEEPFDVLWGITLDEEKELASFRNKQVEIVEVELREEFDSYVAKKK